MKETITTKLVLNKHTIANLDDSQMNSIVGGDGDDDKLTYPCHTRLTCRYSCDCPAPTEPATR
jgi:natural product precursor